MKVRNYILVDKRPVATTDSSLWARHFECISERTVAKEKLPNGIEVSTVFLGVDHAWDGPPLLFETMIFVNGEPADGCRRYSTWEEAEAGHAQMVEVAKGIINFANTPHE